MNNINNGEAIVKVVLVGSSNVGKTSIVSRIMKNEFTDQPPTIGVSFVTHFIYLNNQCQVRLQIWDTAGDERFKSVTPMYFKDCNVVLIVYAINEHSSFDAVKEWREMVLSNTEVEPLIFIVGNKIDLEDRKITIKEQMELENQFENTTFYEVSAKSGVNVFELFNLVAEKALQTNHIRTNVHNSIDLQKETANKTETDKCC